MLLEQCLISSQVDSDFSMKIFMGLFNYKKIDKNYIYITEFMKLLENELHILITFLS